ncbi:MAG: hypothetical protein ACFFDW_09855 [Candidatus Thorarchaeota archaeon]
MKKAVKIITIISILIIVLGTSGFLTYYFVFQNNNPCVEQPFTYYPVEMSRLNNIVPLGNLNPPGHTYPTDHIYFFTDTITYPDGFEIYSPGNITITKVSKVNYNPPQGIISEDYTIEFDVCRYVSGKFGHINNLSTYLLGVLGGFGEEFGDKVEQYEIDGRIYTNYKKNTNLNIEAGQLLGRAGMGGGYDFWLKDTRVNLNWVNNQISRQYQNTVCPLDYFIDDLKTVLHGKLGGWGSIDPPGYCGKIDFDVPDTAQGLWHREGWSNNEAEEYGLALVYNNINSSEGAISIGNAGEFDWDKNVYYFNPLELGSLNQRFDQVTNDGNIYYYFCFGFEFGSFFSKVILIKLIANDQLYLQFVNQNGVELPLDPSILFDDSLAVRYIR